MADDLFRGGLGAVIAFVTAIVFFGAFYFDIITRNAIWIIFFFAFGGLNYWNYRITWKNRYLVLAMVFVLAGIAGLLNSFFSNLFQWKTIWLVAVIVFALTILIGALLRDFGVRLKTRINRLC